MIDIPAKHLNIIKKILKKYPYKFYVFGSRATGKATEYSDLDLCVKEKISLKEHGNIKNDFEESNLPYTVDLIIWSDISDTFKKHIEKDLIELKY